MLREGRIYNKINKDKNKYKQEGIKAHDQKKD